jgi:hypothetical protein
MYANLRENMSECSISQKGVKNIHVFVYIKGVCLLCEVIGPHSAPHLGRVVFWVPNKYLE